MKFIYFFIPSVFMGFFSFSQKSNITTLNPKFSSKINSYLSFTVPVISVHDLNKMKDATILDARAIEEFQVSHIPGAKWIGDGKPDAAILAKIPKDKPVVIYCSIGYRSEKMGERLKKSGFSKVYNLYGSIFEWANENLPLKNASGAPTKEVHVYNKSWGKWMENKDYTKIY